MKNIIIFLMVITVVYAKFVISKVTVENADDKIEICLKNNTSSECKGRNISAELQSNSKKEAVHTTGALLATDWLINSLKKDNKDLTKKKIKPAEQIDLFKEAPPPIN